ncbi:hypothetical protein [Micropruina sonneratiae]|uniref:hypothetical protein n=1 Tax=Micropruina sonneratiae TaxID=2986940 RepID=UPI002225C710|nr:hypothetical protein [Micropruina sp. KQZ13P-5]MCW3159655.1 hypothetical protein [Micropruina sp. KQZ13P-5]
MWIKNPQRRVAVALFTTGQSIERLVISPLLGVVVILMCWWRASIHSPAQLAYLLHAWMAGHGR